jgi:hypothetical protein
MRMDFWRHTAVQEPANHVLIWLLNGLLGYGHVAPPGSPTFAYYVLYDPKLKYYMFNVVEVAAELGAHTPPASLTVQPTVPGRLGEYKSKP